MTLSQEDYNSMMRYPWESSKSSLKQPINKCPQCGYNYCGDGKNLCTECKVRKTEFDEMVDKL